MLVLAAAVPVTLSCAELTAVHSAPVSGAATGWYRLLQLEYERLDASQQLRLDVIWHSRPALWLYVAHNLVRCHIGMASGGNVLCFASRHHHRRHHQVASRQHVSMQAGQPCRTAVFVWGKGKMGEALCRRSLQ